jgi:hypothetical protein
MERITAYSILGAMWNDAAPEQREALNIAMGDVQFVDLTPDAVNPVRCKDCFHKEDTEHDRLIHCVQLNVTVPDIFYCCYGERRTD